MEVPGQGQLADSDAGVDPDVQTTQYVYGVSPSIGSMIYSNDLLAEVRYPDKTTGAAGTANADKERYAYNAVGEVILMTDRNGNTHAYKYDTLGRRLSDAVTVLGSGVDGAVRRIETAYDVAGRANRFTTYNAASGGSVVNEVTREFNYLGQLTTEYQAHAGAEQGKDTGTHVVNRFFLRKDTQ